jgi:transcriptional regulator with XRE-family HTH domain
MPSSQRRADRGTMHAAGVLHRLGDELREARVAAGLSQPDLGGAVGLSHTQVGRLERGVTPHGTVLTFARLFSVLGMRLSARVYPEAPPLRDAAHARLLQRLAGELPRPTRLRTEVRLQVEGPDRRAWDAEIVGVGWRCKVEAETRIRDLQALDRRIALKMADDRVDCVILLVARTASNGRVLREFGQLVSERYPLRSRAILAALRAGRSPGASGILVL